MPLPGKCGVFTTELPGKSLFYSFFISALIFITSSLLLALYLVYSSLFLFFFNNFIYSFLALLVVAHGLSCATAFGVFLE